MHGIVVNSSELEPWCVDGSVEGALRCLGRYDIDAQSILLGPKDLSFLAESSVLWVDDSPAVVVGRDRRGLICATPQGQKLSVTSGANVQSRALSLRPLQNLSRGFKLATLSEFYRDPKLRRATLVAVTASAMTTALGVLVALLSRTVVDDVIPDGSESLLDAFALAVALIALHAGGVHWLHNRCRVYLESAVVSFTSQRIVRHLLSLSLADSLRSGVGRNMELIRSADSAARNIVTFIFTGIDGGVTLAYLGLVFFLDVSTGAIVFLLFVISMGVSVALGWKLERQRTSTLRNARIKQDALLETLTGFETVKTQAAEEHFVRRFSERHFNFQIARLSEEQTHALLNNVVTTVGHAAYGIALVALTRRALGGRASVGDLMAATLAVTSFMLRAEAVIQLPIQYKISAAEYESLEAVVRQPATPMSESARDIRVAPDMEEALVLRDVWYRYGPDLPWGIKGISRTIRRGEHVIFKWPSGAGKSTLLRILAGLIPPERGDVMVYGRDAGRARGLVTYIPQGASLSALSVRDTLDVLSGGAEDERIFRAAEATGLAQVVEGWPMRYDTLLGPGGANVSSGQRQLIIFTAAIATVAPILLLDEALSHMDGVMRCRLAGVEMLRGRTVISVSHDARFEPTGSNSVGDS